MAQLMFSCITFFYYNFKSTSAQSGQPSGKWLAIWSITKTVFFSLIDVDKIAQCFSIISDNKQSQDNVGH